MVLAALRLDKYALVQKKSLGHLITHLPASAKSNPIVQEIADMATDVNLHFVHITYNSPALDTNSSGHEFSRSSVRERAAHGYEDMKAALKNPTWHEPTGPHIGSVIHHHVHPVRR